MDSQEKINLIKEKYLGSIIILLIISFILFSSCSMNNENRELVENDFLSIRAGMTANQVKAKLGKPDKVIKDYLKVQKLMSDDSEYATDRWEEEHPKFYYKFYGSKTKAKEYYRLRKGSRSIICYEYDYKYKKSSKEIEQWHIYFLNDKVIGMYFP